MKRLVLLVLSVLAIAGSTTLAAPISFTFQNAIFQDGDRLTGTISIDPVTGKFTSINAILNVGSSSIPITGAISGGTINETSGALTFTGILFGNPQDELLLVLPVPTLVGYQGGPLCDKNNLCALNSNFQARASSSDALTSGSLVVSAPAVTPEPSSLTLMGTGLLGSVAFLRRRVASNEGIAE